MSLLTARPIPYAVVPFGPFGCRQPRCGLLVACSDDVFCDRHLPAFSGTSLSLARAGIVMACSELELPAEEELPFLQFC